MRTYPRHQVRRIKERAQYERADIHAILDAGCIAHVAFASAGQPFVIPMLYARDGDSLLLHGGIASRLQQQLASGIEACVCVTLLDGLVLARSQFHHSANYRSVVAFGRAALVSEPAAKAAALARFVEALIPGRTTDARAADPQELAATSVVHFAITDASAKVRRGDPKDDPADLTLPVWAGVLPIERRFGTAQPAGNLADDVALPGYLPETGAEAPA